MTAIFRIISVALLVTLALTGCNGPRFNFVGHWEGHRAIQTTPGTAEYITNTLSKVNLFISEKGSFDIADSGIPKAGEVSFQGQKAVLTIRTVNRIPIVEEPSKVKDAAAPIELTAQPDGTVLYNDPSAGDSKPIVLTRSATE